MKKKWLLILFIPVAFIAFQCGYTFVLPSLHKQRLLAACENANRLVVDLNVFPESQNQPELPTYEVTGREAIYDLLTAVEFEHAWTAWRCMCYGDILLKFYADDEHLATLSFHHGESFRSKNELWYGNSKLTPTACKSISDWLKHHNCPDCDMAYKMRHPSDESLPPSRSSESSPAATEHTSTSGAQNPP